MPKRTKARFRDSASWLLLSAVASSGNLACLATYVRGASTCIIHACSIGRGRVAVVVVQCNLLDSLE